MEIFEKFLQENSDKKLYSLDQNHRAVMCEIVGDANAEKRRLVLQGPTSLIQIVHKFWPRLLSRIFDILNSSTPFPPLPLHKKLSKLSEISHKYIKTRLLRSIFDILNSSTAFPPRPLQKIMKII